MPSGHWRGSSQRGRGRGRGRGASSRGRDHVKAKDFHKKQYGNKKKKKGYNAQSDRDSGFTLKVAGYPPGTKKSELIDFFNEKCEEEFNFTKCYIDKKQNALILEIEKRVDAIAVQKLSGIRFNGEKVGQQRQRAFAQGTRVIRSVIKQRYHHDNHFLSLSNIAGDNYEGYKVELNKGHFLQSLWNALSVQCPDVEMIDFSGNNIYTLQGFKSAGHLLSHLSKLNFSDNCIRGVKELDHLKHLHLSELLFVNNPIVPSETDVVGTQRYRNEIARRFPAVKYLDSVEIEPIIKFDIPDHLVRGTLPNIKGSYLDSPDTQSLARSFLETFFNLYDNERDSLYNAYRDDSFLSVTIPGQGFKFKPGRKKNDTNNLFSYRDISRNLEFINDMSQRAKLLKQGRIDILYTLRELPDTNHSLDEIIVDCFTIAGTGTATVICLSVHGAFWEVENAINRSFDRTFLLTPGASGHFPLEIMNDQLHVRPYVSSVPSAEGVVGHAVSRSSTGFTSAGKIAVPPLLTAPSKVSFGNPFQFDSDEKDTPPKKAHSTREKHPVSPVFKFDAPPVAATTKENTQDILSSDKGNDIFAVSFTSNNKEKTIQAFMKKTGMVRIFAASCLEKNGWNATKAWNNFQMLKRAGTLPADAFGK